MLHRASLTNTLTMTAVYYSGDFFRESFVFWCVCGYSLFTTKTQARPALAGGTKMHKGYYYRNFKLELFII